jgi:predicted transcriptional regulator
LSAQLGLRGLVPPRTQFTSTKPQPRAAARSNVIVRSHPAAAAAREEVHSQLAAEEAVCFGWHFGIIQTTPHPPGQVAMKTITLKLPDTLDHRLTHFAGLQKASSKSAVVRQAIEFYLSVSPQSTEPSAAVMATKWLGLLKGPADLSTNPKYLDDIGR